MVKKKTCILCSTSDETISYFSFPTNERRSEWLRLCKITRDIPKTAVLCAKHFSNESFSKNPDMSKHRRRLKMNAIPSEYLDPGISDEIPHSVESRATAPFYRWCYICGSVNDSQLSIHRFPKNVADQSVWLSKCGQRQSSTRDLNNLRLCSLHFSSDSFIENPQTKKRYLKPGVVPINTTEMESISYTDVNNFIKIEPTEEAEAFVLEYTDESTDVVATPIKIENDVAAISLKFVDRACQTENDLLQPLTNMECSEPNAQPSSGTTPTTSYNNEDLLLDHSHTLEGASKTVRNPRYVGNICTPHLATPNRAKRCLNMIKKVIERKNQTIASLSRKLRFAQEKLETLKNLISHLRNVQYINESASHELMVCDA